MKLKNNSLIAGGFAHPKNRLPTNSSEANKLLKTFQTQNSGFAQNATNNGYNLLKTFQTANMQSAQKVIRINLSSLHTSLRGAQILSENIIYSQKKDSVQAVLIWTQQGIKTNGYEFNYIRLALSYNSLRVSVTSYPDDIGLVQHSNLVNDIQSVDCLGFRCLRLIDSKIDLGRKPPVSFSGGESSLSEGLSVCLSIDYSPDCLVSLPTFETESVQPFGSMPNRFNSLRQAALTHALNGLLPITDSICSSKSSSKRIIFIVLLVRLNGFFSFFSCIGKYHYVNLSLIGKYHNTRYTYKKATPRSDANTIEASNHNVKESYTMAIYKSTQTHPKLIQHHSAKFFAQYKPVKNNLPLLVEFSYIDSAPYKTGVRYCSLKYFKATHDAESVFFCVQRINAPYSMVLCVPLITVVKPRSSKWDTPHHPSMVALMGQPSGWLVSLKSSTAIPVNVTTPLEYCSSGGDSLKLQGASIMASSAYPKFLWRFFSCQQSKFFTVEATSEQEARSMLPDAPCLFSARIRQGG